MSMVSIPLHFPKVNIPLSIEYIGYGTREETVVLNKNIRKDYKLKPETIELSGIELTANAVPKAAVRKPEMSVASVPQRDRKSVV